MIGYAKDFIFPCYRKQSLVKKTPSFEVHMGLSQVVPGCTP